MLSQLVSGDYPHPLSRWLGFLVGSTPTLPIVDSMTGLCPCWSLSRAQYTPVTPELGGYCHIVMVANQQSLIVTRACCVLLLCFYSNS